MDQDVVAPWRELVVIMEESLLFDYAGKNNPSMAEEESLLRLLLPLNDRV